MSMLGKQIKKYRLEKGITQEKLGELVGVTTQAVSKWERGGTPDVELLPQLAQVLEVSIDALFGREDQGFALSLLKKIASMPNKEAFRYTFDILWAIILGFMPESKSMPENRLMMDLDHESIDATYPACFARVMYDEGTINARVSSDFRHFFLMLEPEDGLLAQFADPQQLRQVFEALADENRLKIIYYLYTRLNTPIATSLISKNVGLSEQEVDWHMGILSKQGILKRTIIATSDGEIYSYMFNQEDSVVAMLCFADEIIRKEDPNLLWSMSRTKPIFKSNGG